MFAKERSAVLPGIVKSDMPHWSVAEEKTGYAFCPSKASMESMVARCPHLLAESSIRNYKRGREEGIMGDICRLVAEALPARAGAPRNKIFAYVEGNYLRSHDHYYRVLEGAGTGEDKYLCIFVCSRDHKDRKVTVTQALFYNAGEIDKAGFADTRKAVGHMRRSYQQGR